MLGPGPSKIRGEVSRSLNEEKVTDLPPFMPNLTLDYHSLQHIFQKHALKIK
jgi:hypothetical protein